VVADRFGVVYVVPVCKAVPPDEFEYHLIEPALAAADKDNEPDPHLLDPETEVIVGFAFTVIALVVPNTHPVEDENEKVTVPGPTPVTRPAFVIVATDVLLLDHVPPEVGETVVVAPTHIVVEPVILMVAASHFFKDIASKFKAVPFAYPSTLIFVVLFGVSPSIAGKL
jgi:hypothetical protein